MKTSVNIFLLVLAILYSNSISVLAQDFKWVKGLSSSSGKVAGLGIAVDTNGITWVSGDFTGTVTFGSTQLTSYGYEDIFLAKYDPDGNCLWAKHAGGNDYDEAICVSVDLNGNSYITGYFYGTVLFDSIQLSSSNEEMFIAKYDPDGNCIWAKQSLSKDAAGWGISIDSKGYVYTAGSFAGIAQFGTIQLTGYGNFDIFIVKYDSDGNCVWVKNAGGTGTDEGTGLSVDVYGNICVTGFYYSLSAAFGSFHLTNPTIPSGNAELFVAKYDQDGNCLWAKQAGGSGGGGGYGVTFDANRNCYVTGLFYHDVTFGTIQLNSHGYEDIFLIKYDSDGNCLWAKQAGGINTDIGGAISVDESGSIYITGHIADTVKFGSITLTSNGIIDMFIAKYNPDGNCLWAIHAGGPNGAEGRGISFDSYGNSYFTGIFKDSALFGTIPLSVNNLGTFIAKIPSSPVAIKNEINSTPKEYSLQQNYPNPFNPSTTIKYQLPQSGNVTLKVYDVLGREVAALLNKYNNAGTYSVSFNASNLPSGIYFYKLEAGYYSQIKKMIILK